MGYTKVRKNYNPVVHLKVGPLIMLYLNSSFFNAMFVKIRILVVRGIVNKYRSKRLTRKNWFAVVVPLQEQVKTAQNMEHNSSNGSVGIVVVQHRGFVSERTGCAIRATGGGMPELQTNISKKHVMHERVPLKLTTLRTVRRCAWVVVCVDFPYLRCEPFVYFQFLGRIFFLGGGTKKVVSLLNDRGLLLFLLLFYVRQKRERIFGKKFLLFYEKSVPKQKEGLRGRRTD
eukprot:TRINITY_DN67871_c0_g1_i1.p3 TRINITY_DN67871_c0_g1~~TRINITY_DN67871_c0_g1_i1.p3  ORF type:complete len:230 (-),score=15.52 TRINITY_DN67871_c0_g1_i1:121-810(-)